MVHDQIPGFTRAMERVARAEDRIRERVFLPIGETLAGLPVRQLTTGDVVILINAKSAFFTGAVPFPDEICAFLWVLQPDYSPAKKGRRAFARAISRRLGGPSEIGTPTPAYRRLVRAIHRYLDRAFMDMPAILDGPSGYRVSASFPAVVVHQLCTAYGWTREQALREPVAAVFQYFPLITQDRATVAGGESPPRQTTRFANAIRERLLSRARKSAIRNPQSAIPTP